MVERKSYHFVFALVTILFKIFSVSDIWYM